MLRVRASSSQLICRGRQEASLPSGPKKTCEHGALETWLCALFGEEALRGRDGIGLVNSTAKIHMTISPVVLLSVAMCVRI